MTASTPIAGTPIAGVLDDFVDPDRLTIEIDLFGSGGRQRFTAATVPIALSLTATGMRRRLFAALAAIDIDVRAIANFLLKVATHEFVSSPSSGNAAYLGVLRKALTVTRSLLNGPRPGQVAITWGQMELINSEGDFDAYINRFSIDGQPFVLRLGASNNLNDFAIVTRGTVVDWHVAEDILTVETRDSSYLLEVPAQPNIYAGTGGIEGGEDLKGKRRPRGFGRVRNASPVFVMPEELLYQINDGEMQSINAVYVRGEALTLADDYPDVASLLAASQGSFGSGADIEAGSFATCLAEGYFRLGGTADGQVTVDFYGDKTDGVYVETTAGIVRRVLSAAPKFFDPDHVYEPSFARVDAEQPAPIGYYLDSSRDSHVADVVADLLGGVGGWGGYRPRINRFEIGIFRLAEGEVPAFSYDKPDLIEIERIPLPDGLSPPPRRFRVAWGRNWTKQTSDLAGDVTQNLPDRVAFLAEDYRLAEASDGQIEIDHPRAQDPDPVLAWFDAESDAKDEADRLLAMFGQTVLSAYRFKLKAQPFLHELNQVVRLTYPRWDLTEGRSLRIVEISEDTDDNFVTLVGIG